MAARNPNRAGIVLHKFSSRPIRATKTSPNRADCASLSLPCLERGRGGDEATPAAPSAGGCFRPSS
jgi:hypothetical protein